MPAFAGEINRLTPVQSTSGRPMLCITRDDVNLRSVTTVLREIETVGSRTSELANVESKVSDLDRNIRSVTALQDMFVVNDPLEGYTYVIARSESGYQLTFMLKDGRQVIVAVEPTGDTALLAQRIAERLMESGNRLLCLGLGPATEVYDGCMMD